MGHSNLKDHDFKKGKFITPFNSIHGLNTEVSWFHERLPEYLWLGLIIHAHGRQQGLAEGKYIIDQLINLIPKLKAPRLSDVFNLSENLQYEYFSFVAEHIGTTVLAPLTVIFPYIYNRPFSITFNVPGLSTQERLATINEVLKKTSGHQEHLSTDIRFLVIYPLIATGQLRFTEETSHSMELIKQYPILSHDNEIMRMARPAVRSLELVTISALDSDIHNQRYLDYFWEGVSKMTECDTFYLEFDEPDLVTEDFCQKIKDILDYYVGIFSSIKSTDIKMITLLGIATYSYKLVMEIFDNRLTNSILGRMASRVIIENYIEMKYLLKHESEHEDIWIDYQYYGIGQYKLINKRYDEKSKQSKEKLDTQFPQKLIEILVNEYRDEEFIDMDTSYFDRTSIRDKAIDVDERELFGLLYDYDSAYMHGLWGAIRESSLLKCNSPGHHFHCVPDIECIQNLTSVWEDCKNTMKKMLLTLKSVYGLPEHFEIEDL